MGSRATVTVGPEYGRVDPGVKLIVALAARRAGEMTEARRLAIILNDSALTIGAWSRIDLLWCRNCMLLKNSGDVYVYRIAWFYYRKSGREGVSKVIFSPFNTFSKC